MRYKHIKEHKNLHKKDIRENDAMRYSSTR